MHSPVDMLYLRLVSLRWRKSFCSLSLSFRRPQKVDIAPPFSASKSENGVPMYAVDARDEVLSFEAVPIPSAGAPIPLIPASDNSHLLAYEVAPDGKQYAVLNSPLCSLFWFAE
jgi:hypothetical protein